jgi:hypothetical protein
VYGRDPPSLRSYTAGEACLPALQQQLQDRDEFLLEVREWLEQAQNYQKASYDKKHHEVEFTVGQWVWVRLLHQPLASLDVRGRSNLDPKYFRSYQIVERLGMVAYRLQLPAGARLHDVFHVGLLKRHHGEPLATPVQLPAIRHGRACLEPTSVLKSRLARGHHELLVHWKGQTATDASWMALNELRSLFPTFQLEDKLIVQGGRDVMWGLQYERHGKKQGNQTAEVAAEIPAPPSAA